MLLDRGQDRHHAHADAQDLQGGQERAENKRDEKASVIRPPHHVKRDEELVQLALPGALPRVVDVEEDDGGEGARVHGPGGREECGQPALGVRLLVVAHPGLGPGVSKVDDQDQLDQDEDEGAHEADVHPNLRGIWGNGENDTFG